MKAIKWVLPMIIAAPLVAQASCETVKADINKKIIDNGVPASGFTLEIVPNDQADRAAGQVVGHCESDTHKIIYKRGGENDTDAPVGAGSSQDAPPS